MSIKAAGSDPDAATSRRVHADLSGPGAGAAAKSAAENPGYAERVRAAL